VFAVQVTMQLDKFSQKNQPDALISQIYFLNKTLHVSDSSSVHHQEFFTVHTAMVYVLTACEEDQDGTRLILLDLVTNIQGLLYINICTVRLLLFCTMTNKRKIVANRTI